MKTLFAALLLTVGSLSAQSTPAVPPAASAAQLPTSWAGVRATYGGSFSGGADYAQLVSNSVGIYSFTSHDFTRISAKPYVQDVTSTGAAVLLRSFGNCSGWCAAAFALGQVGAAVSSTSTTTAYNTGGFVMVKLSTTKWTVGAGWKMTTGSTATTKAYSFEFGRILK